MMHPGTTDRLLKHYQESYNRALVEFCEDWWPCSFEHKHGPCVNPRRNHDKGHQNSKGKILKYGPYTSQNDFTVESYQIEWHKLLDTKLHDMRRRLDERAAKEPRIDEEQASVELHHQLLEAFYANMEDLAASLTNPSACFCCLRELPEHPLPCGHILCTPCVKSFAAEKGNVSYMMDHCPLHPRSQFSSNCQILIKPSMAGVRILTLDG